MWGNSSLVVGVSNLVSTTATSSQESTRYSMIAGFGNVISNNCESLLVSGKSNTVQAFSTLVSGTSNTVGGAGIGTPAYHLAAIGQYNQILATHGWSIGYSNTVTGNRGVAIGSGAVASNDKSIALGQFNATMDTSRAAQTGIRHRRATGGRQCRTIEIHGQVRSHRAQARQP